MKLHTLKRSKGIIEKSKRIGRGNGSGKGNYSTKGLKGQKARSGTTTKAFFEGGQTSIVQRIPKARGFKRYYKLVKEVVIVNLGYLDKDVRIIDDMEITKKVLSDLGYIKNDKVCVKILGNGDWTKKVNFIDIDMYSASAKEKIANPGIKKVSAPKGESKKELKEEKKAPVKKVSAPKGESKKEPKEEKKTPVKKVSAPKGESKKEPKGEKKAPVKKPTVKKTEKSTLTKKTSAKKIK